MIATLEILREKYGGAEGYLKDYTKLTDDDLEKIRRNFLVARSA
jgi:hypothetical protein